MRMLNITCLVAMMAGAGAAASARTVDFSSPASAHIVGFTLSDAAGDTASGQLTLASPTLPTTVTAITGVFDGLAITGLSSYAGADQALVVPSPSYFTYGGLSFSAGGVDYNLTSYPTGLGSVINSVTDPNGFGIAPVAITSFAIAAPEPAAWAMMLVGFAGLGGAIRSRRHTRAIAA